MPALQLVAQMLKQEALRQGHEDRFRMSSFFIRTGLLQATVADLQDLACDNKLEIVSEDGTQCSVLFE